MRNLFLISLIVFGAITTAAHEHHVKHNMVLFGEEEIFISHIVYKVPHNYQVILKVELEASAKAAYLREKAANPTEQFILLLDHMDISKIEQKPNISGEMFRRDAAGRKTIISKNTVLNPDQYSVVYFDEVPLDLSQ